MVKEMLLSCVVLYVNRNSFVQTKYTYGRFMSREMRTRLALAQNLAYQGQYREARRIIRSVVADGSIELPKIMKKV